MRTIGVVTVGRSDYSIYLPVLRRIEEAPELKLHLIVAGMHLAPEFGLTAQAIEADGFAIGDRVHMLLASDTPEGIAKSMGVGIMGFAQSYARVKPDILVVLGDRFEMHAAALSALPFTIPVAHIHGGELTEGAIDDALRHSITKLSHLHFVATRASARRVIQMGEEPWRVIVSGAPALDNLRSITLLSRDELEARFGLRLESAPLLVTYHSVTLEYEQAQWQVGQLLDALRACQMPVVFTMPNADTNSRAITALISEFVKSYPRAQMVANFGPQGYFSLMAHAAAMVGNSSSGMIEAPSLGLPVVNIGTRQQGRLRAENVLESGYDRDDIMKKIQQAVAPEFRARLQGCSNPYGDGHASDIIVKRLKDVSLDHRLTRKRFADLPAWSPTRPEPEVAVHAD